MSVFAKPASSIKLRPLEPIREVWIHGEAFAASHLSMMRIMARRMNAAGGGCVAFEVASEATVTTDPRERSFDDPPFTQHLISDKKADACQWQQWLLQDSADWPSDRGELAIADITSRY